jgi:DNA polymerase I-like protein with 3'-5' exonuclease and polymerase domains
MNDSPKEMLALSKDCKPFNIRCLVSDQWKEAKQRILVVIQHVDSEDLKSHRLLTGPAGDVIPAMFKLAEQYASPAGFDKYELAFVNFNYFKTYHLERDDTRRLANSYCARRVLKLVEKLRPHKVFVIGDEAAEALLPKVPDLRMFRGWGHRREGCRSKFYTTIDFTKTYSKTIDDDGENEEQQDKVMDYANLLGFISRNLGNCLHGDHVYKIEVKARPVLIDSIPRFRKFYKKLCRAKRFAYDTETPNLNRVDNDILFMQFAFDQHKGYIVPLNHKDSPFTQEERQYICRKMRDFWSEYRDPLDKDYGHYYIGQNLKFDDTVTRQKLKVYTIKRRQWDLMAGEYALDENLKGLRNYADKDDAGVYTLSQMELYYGCRAHYDGEFKKSDAALIKDRRLKDRDVQDYMALDVQVPWAIHDQQIERSKNVPHLNDTYEKDFRRFVVTQMSNMIHIQSIMEHRGTHTDVKWMETLNKPGSPLEKARAEIQAKLFAMPSVIKANSRLAKKAGKPMTSLFGNTKPAMSIDLNKKEHKLALFMGVLGLKPVGFGKDGETPKIDKPFQERHKAVPEVALFTELSSVSKLRTAFVKPYLRRLRDDPEFRLSHKLRPSFGFVDTTTGRSNSFDPNLQQIPTRSNYAKLIKRIFAARRGFLKMKMDYSAHEVRLWSITSGDKQLGGLFDAGRRFRQKYRATGKPKYKALMETQGDIHIQNVAFFFGKRLEDIKKVPKLDKDGKPELGKDGKPKLAFPTEIAELRDAVKSVVFGAIYGRGPKSIGVQIKKDKEYVEKLLKKFFPRFPKASKWLDSAKAMPLRRNYVYSPIGRRRNLYGHLFGLDNLVAMVERRGCNSPIQGLAADMGHTAAYLFGIYYEQFMLKYYPEMWEKLDDPGNIEVMVHDSIDGDFPYEVFLAALQIMQWCATIGCMQFYERHYGIKFTTPLEVEFEIGTDSANLEKWDWSESQLKEILHKALATQKERFGDKMDLDRATAKVFSIRKNQRVQKYLDRNFPVLPDVPQELLAA